ncbi:MAG: V-type ATP synthase subunit D [Promethearchaeota archaeon]|nr:MAG: V-type ATP synthase subunit D [Candidatus Lokiarchaeota archaeon]
MSFRKIKVTKTNLLKLEKKKSFAEKGKKFLEFKREQLNTEINTKWKSYLLSKDQFMGLFRKVVVLMHQTYKEMGKRDLLLISDMSKFQYYPKLSIQYTKDFGIRSSEISIAFDKKKKLPSYNFNNSSHFLDDLVLGLKQFVQKLTITAEKEETLIFFAHNFNKVNRRINALKNIIIPDLESKVKQIKNQLEEIERENFVRLKKTKELLEKKRRTITI